MILPHFDLIVQCMDVVKGLPIESWEEQTRPVKRSSGLVGRWAIDKAFQAAILSCGVEFPKDRSLMSLRNASGVNLVKEQLLLLETVDQNITSHEPEETDDLELYLDCCLLARGIVGTVHQSLTTADVLERNHKKEMP